jgi:hypothetical protein
MFPQCVPCKREVGKYRARPAVFLVTVGRSQVERFECEQCQTKTGNPIKVRILDTIPSA